MPDARPHPKRLTGLLPACQGLARLDLPPSPPSLLCSLGAGTTQAGRDDLPAHRQPAAITKAAQRAKRWLPASACAHLSLNSQTMVASSILAETLKPGTSAKGRCSNGAWKLARYRRVSAFAASEWKGEAHAADRSCGLLVHYQSHRGRCNQTLGRAAKPREQGGSAQRLGRRFSTSTAPPAALPQTVVVHDLQHHTQDCAAAGRPPALLKRHSCFGTAPGCAICLDNFREFGETSQVADPG